MSGKRRLRPGSASLLGMMVFNAVVSVAVLCAVYALFGLNSVLAQRLTQVGTLGVAAKWETLWPLMPGAAIGFALLWFCQVIVGRSRGVNWAGAFFYGMGIAFCNVLLGGLINGILHGNPLMGLLLGLADADPGARQLDRHGAVRRDHGPPQRPPRPRLDRPLLPPPIIAIKNMTRGWPPKEEPPCHIFYGWNATIRAGSKRRKGTPMSESNSAAAGQYTRRNRIARRSAPPDQ